MFLPLPEAALITAFVSKTSADPAVVAGAVDAEPAPT
jgi:hypothetical protein